MTQFEDSTKGGQSQFLISGTSQLMFAIGHTTSLEAFESGSMSALKFGVHLQSTRSQTLASLLVVLDVLVIELHHFERAAWFDSSPLLHHLAQTQSSLRMVVRDLLIKLNGLGLRTESAGKT